jgi:hypothetical protein
MHMIYLISDMTESMIFGINKLTKQMSCFTQSQTKD